MDSIEFFQVFIIIIILIMTLFYIYFRSLTSSSSSAAAAAVYTDMPPLREKYDVFISFRGEDTRDGFTSYLHKALLGKKIETYMDYRLEKGDDIGPALLEAIEKSKIALVIFSKDYASSTWCLKELVHILGCKKSHGQIVIPIFYRIDPSHVRKQQGTYALGGLLWRLKKRFKGSRDEVANWRAALEEAANMSGFPYSSKTGRTEADFVEEVVQDVLTKLNRESSGDLKGLFGIQRKIEKIELLLCLDSPGVCCVGIWGMGGIGKTTLADAVFHRQRQSSKFEVCCFLANVRERSDKMDGLNDLRNALVGEILKDKDVNINTPSIPSHILIRLRRTKALIVLDDVNARKPLEVLVGDHDWFCQGSRIIITARDKGLLEQKVDHEKIYNVEVLGSDDALELFHSHAFGNKSPTTDHTELSREVVDYVKGNPLALKVMGSSFRRCKSKEEWEVQWKKVKQFPNEEINQVLRISYDGLGKHEKEIFLDIVCFHKGRWRNYVEASLDSGGFVGEAGINDLIDSSLISISKGEQIDVHDLVQEMGRAIAREQRIEKRTRLFISEDVYQVLINNQRALPVQAISVDWNDIENLHLKDANFEKMYQLRWLRVGYYHHQSAISSNFKYPIIISLDFPNSLRCLDWYRYPLKSLPSKFSAQNLVVLRLQDSKVEGQLWNEDESPVNLKWICLSQCKDLTEVPNLSRSLKIEHINLFGCQSLVEIPSYFQHLSKLTYLNLAVCYKLKYLPEMPCILEFLNLSNTAIEELPSSVWSHEKISYLDITCCRHLKSLPSNSCELKLSNPKLSGFFSLACCESLHEFWELPKKTKEITLYNCRNLVSLPTSIWKLKYLESIQLSYTAIKEVPPSIGNLVALREVFLTNCKNLEVVPDDLFCLTSLQKLDLSWTKIKSIPASIKQAAQLSCLRLSDCKSLESLPELPPLLRYLEAHRCTSLKTVSSSSTALTQGWGEYIFSRGINDKYIFSGCPKLDQDARSNIMGDAQLRIMRMANAFSKFKEDKIEGKIEQASHDSEHMVLLPLSEQESFRKRSFVAIRCSGNEIPNWVSHKSEGCSIKIELPRDWFSTGFLGFAISLVVSSTPWDMKIGCKYNFKTSNGESHEVNHCLNNMLPGKLFESGGDSHEVFLGWYNHVFEEVVEGAPSPIAFYELVTEVNVHFHLKGVFNKPCEVEVEKCGICLLYGKDAEMIKQRALSIKRL